MMFFACLIFASKLLILDPPPTRWDEAIMLGNGIQGSLIWMDPVKANQVNISLDRGDIWDLRQAEIFSKPDWNYKSMQKWVKEKNEAKLHEYFDWAYDNLAYPTKLPGGRIELVIDPHLTLNKFKLDLARAEATLNDLNGHDIQAFEGATNNVGMLRAPFSLEATIRRPAGLDRLGYAPAVSGSQEGTTNLKWIVQEAALGLRYAIVVGTQPRSRSVELAWTIVSSRSARDPLAEGKREVLNALGRGYDENRAPHLAWWRTFWESSSITIPDARLQSHYDLVKYFYGSASRKGAPPMPLQGVWTADEGGLPPWKGDFHNDLNTQMTYIATHVAGLEDSEQSWLDYNWKLMPQYRRFAKQFFGTDGAAIPGVMDLDGKPLGGWGQYSLSPTNGAWIAQSFYRHWKFTRDRSFLKERGYPFCSAVAKTLASLLVKGEDGKLRLPLSTSPEIFDNSMQAWLQPNSNFDNALMAALFGWCAEMAGELGVDAKNWVNLRAALPKMILDDEGGLAFAKDLPYRESHRHMSHAMAIHPLETLEPGSKVARTTIERIIKEGTSAWCGYSFSWFAAMLAHAGDGDRALRYLADYERAFTLRNGFHANGDQTKSGLSNFQYRPFTLEGNFLAMEAIHEMLIQSDHGQLRVFPAVPAKWANASFRDLRAEGGFRVSAERVAGKTVWVEVGSTTSGTLSIADPFAGSAYSVHTGTRGHRLRLNGNALRFTMRQGDRVRLERL